VGLGHDEPDSVHRRLQYQDQGKMLAGRWAAFVGMLRPHSAVRFAKCRGRFAAVFALAEELTRAPACAICCLRSESVTGEADRLCFRRRGALVESLRG